MRGHTIVVNTGRGPSGNFREGIVASGQTFYPGMIVQRDPTVDLVGGAPTYKIYDRAADGDRPAGALWVVTEILRVEQGYAITDSIAAGERVMCYSPRPGDELNLLYKNVSGTADDVAAGNVMIVDDGTGKLIVTTGTPQSEPAMALEAIVDPTADTLLWCEWAG